MIDFEVCRNCKKQIGRGDFFCNQCGNVFESNLLERNASRLGYVFKKISRKELDKRFLELWGIGASVSYIQHPYLHVMSYILPLAGIVFLPWTWLWIGFKFLLLIGIKVLFSNWMSAVLLDADARIRLAFFRAGKADVEETAISNSSTALVMVPWVVTGLFIAMIYFRFIEVVITIVGKDWATWILTGIIIIISLAARYRQFVDFKLAYLNLASFDEGNEVYSAE